MRNDLQAVVAHLEAMAQNAIGAAADADMPEQQKTALWAEYKALDAALTALREKAERERGCAYCVIGKRSPDAEYCSNCGRKLTPTLPELANESKEVNPDSHQYVDNDSTYRRKSVKQMGRNLYSETAETCTLRCEYCGKYTQDSDLSTEWVGDKYLMCSKCKEKYT